MLVSWFEIWHQMLIKYICMYVYFLGTLSCISQHLYFLLFHSWISQFGSSSFSFLSSSLLCLQINWASFGKQANPRGQSLRRCCKGQGLGWHHACMKRCALLGLVWADTNRSYCISPPDRTLAIGSSLLLSLPHARLGLLFIPCSPEPRHMAVLAFPYCSIKDLKRNNYMILYFCPSPVFC